MPGDYFTRGNPSKGYLYGAGGECQRQNQDPETSAKLIRIEQYSMEKATQVAFFDDQFRCRILTSGLKRYSCLVFSSKQRKRFRSFSPFTKTRLSRPYTKREFFGISSSSLTS